MRKNLFPVTGQLYKANPHCHSTVSDGANTPAEMKAYYRSHGYQILALTDHELLVDEARAHGFIVSVNHPAYSMETPAFFGRLKGLFAMEIHNQGSFYPTSEYNAQMYDQMLRLGHHIGALAADDNHRAFIYDDPVDRRPWGFTMVKAAALTQDAVIQALERGDYYASQGPLIHDLWPGLRVVRSLLTIGLSQQ